MRHLASVIVAVALSGCATAPRNDAIRSTAASSASATACTPPTQRDAPSNWCALPADVRAYVDDRDACDHFRGEPWPETDSDADRARRKDILDGIRTRCAGTDARLADFRARYASEAATMALLSSFETPIER